MKTLLTIILASIIFVGCRKDKAILPEECNNTINNNCYGGDYSKYSTDTFDFVKQHLIGQSTIGPFFEYPNEYNYDNPVFNPNNPYEVIYSKGTTNPLVLGGEIWKFSFCTGQATKIADDFYYNLDWGSNGWIIYTGTGHKIYKIKDNGDSLTVLSTQSGFNRAGKWNPSGTLYWNHRDAGTQIEDINGNTIKNIIYKPIVWINDYTILTQSTGFALYSFNINTELLVQLNSNWTNGTASKIYNSEDNTLFVPDPNGTGQFDYFLKYDLNGSNSVDTIAYMYDSYMYSTGDIANNKIITRLTRQHWKDSLSDTRYVRNNILIMNLDGTEERIINLPE